jgi:uncharacterized protein
MAITAIVKPTHDCNLSCSYCYVEDGAENGKMDSATLEKMTEQLGKVNHGRKSGIIWHGGEPLKMPMDFYEYARYVQHWVEKKEDTKFDNCLQSNGTLLTEEWAEFLRDSHFSIGFSLDGPEEINNLTRKYPNGKGAFNEIVRGIKTGIKYEIGGGFIVVLNKNNINHLDEIYNFIKEMGVGAKLNPLIHSGRGSKDLENLAITPKEYGNAMRFFFDKYFNDRDFKRGLDPFDTIIGNVSTGNPEGCCSFSESCQEHFVSVGPLGDVYPCGRFDGVKNFWMGNVNNSELSDAIKGDVRKELLKRKLEQLSECSPCEHKKICNGGCMSNGYMRKGDFMDKDYYCAGYKSMFDYIGKAVDKELEKAEVKANA